VLDRAAAAISQADMLIVGGTSLSVYPAAGLLEHFKGGRLAVLNKSGAGPLARRSALVITESIGEVLAGVVTRPASDE
jgi:NAD-dependent deacetylase